jgi:hypothetical protein
MTDKRNGYSLEDLKPIMEGTLELPNPEPINGDVGAAMLHYREMHCGTALINGTKQWNARFFLDYGQGGQLYGSGMAAWTGWKDSTYRAQGLKFAICKHTAKSDPGANPIRGWHPAHCTKCGLDMTIDSGD